MVCLRRFLLILLVLICGGRPVYAATSADERAFKAAAKKFQSGFWDFAAKDFAAFVTNFPASPRVPEAILYQAEADITNGHFASAIGLLSANQGRAGEWGDKFLYWTAQAQLANTNYSGAADAFARLIQNYPDSTNRLEACVGQATACARLNDWPRVIQLLQKPDGVFQRLAAGQTNDQAACGYLLLGEAQLAQRDYAGGQATVQSLAARNLNPELAWRRAYLGCRLEMAEGRADEALLNTTNLIALANVASASSLRAESFMLQAGILEQLQRTNEAVSVYEDLAASAPADQQRRALLKITEISLAQGLTTEAIKTLENYWNQYPYSGAADLALLTLGELELKQYLGGAETNRTDPSTNSLRQALQHFDTLLDKFPTSPLAGKALFDRGWCLWAGAKFAESVVAFRTAVERLPFAEDQAVARFKWADAQFMLKDFAGAVTNYNFLAINYAALPEVRERLLEPALYQTVRAAIAVTNLPAANSALQKILEWYPDGFTGDSCLLLVGEGYDRQNDPARARELFTLFEARFPATNALLPQVRLAIARTYEKEGDWAAAITNYEGWLNRFTNHVELPRAEFSLAWDTFMAGQETNALALFQRFVARSPTNELASRAQWWIGDYYFRYGAFYNAESNYQSLFKTWPASELAYPAQKMAGLAAVARLSYKDAIDYFTNLFSNPNCPADLKVQAAFAAGDVFMSRTGPGGTNRQADLNEALSWFNRIVQSYPTNARTPLALARRGDCYKELGLFDERYYEKAAAEYAQMITNSSVAFALRNQARIGLGITVEKQAERKSGPEKIALLEQALEDYVEAFTKGQDPPDGEPPDLFGVRDAGLKAIRIAEQLQHWDQVVQVCRNLRDLIPSLGAVCESRMAKAQEHLKNN